MAAFGFLQGALSRVVRCAINLLFEPPFCHRRQGCSVAALRPNLSSSRKEGYPLYPRLRCIECMRVRGNERAATEQPVASVANGGSKSR